ncbi:Zn-dependent exopeptidase [Mycena galericulata]|nr:Zn-dependent exopeptidase [Mycena galericulata]
MEKQNPSISGAYQPIPLPVTESSAPPPTPPKGRHLFRKLFGLSLILLNLFIFHTFFAAPVARWGYKTFRGDTQGLSAHPTHPPKKGHFIWGKAAEKLFLSVPDEDSAIAASRLFATKPHLAGSEGDLQTAKDFLSLLETEFGIASAAEEPIFEAGSTESRHATNSIPHTHKPKAWIDVYYPVMNTPLDRSLQVVGADGEVVWEAELEEVADETDPEAGEYYNAVPTFHGLSAPGDVQGKLVYANYGRKEDYDDLVEKSVNLTGTIVITRYGGIFRGLKVKGAQDLGAAGVLIYSDLRDDGPVTEANGYLPYPQGPARNVNSVQRGSVQFLSIYPGDPTTPGYPSYENSTRTDGENIPKIPSLPISAANAEKLFKLAENGTEVRLVNHVTPIWNTMGVIPGFIKDEVVVLGNHRDGDHVLMPRKVMGATDPSSGTASVHEVVRGLGALLRHGWRPLRTILIASWDGRPLISFCQSTCFLYMVMLTDVQYGLIGSTEWVEDFPEFIDKNVVTYLNLGWSCTHSLQSASPSLSHFLRQAALDIPHPTSPGNTLWDARNDNGPYDGKIVDVESVAVSQSVNNMADSVGVSPLGSGSDYTFVASSDAGFGGSGQDAIYHYHSVFDSERWQELYADPGFHRHVAVAKHIGLETLRLSSAIILPLNTTHYSYELGNYLDGIESIALDSKVDVDLAPLRKSINALKAASHSLDFEKASAEWELRKLVHKWKKRQSKLKKKLRKVYCRLKKIFGRKCHKDKDLEGHQEAHHGCAGASNTAGHPTADLKVRLGHFAGVLEEQHHEVLRGLAMHAGFAAPAFDAFHPVPKFPGAKLRKAVRRIRAVNKKLIGFEKGFISEDGIPDREWYRHLAIAPGKWLGYGATPMPALAESIQYAKNATLAQHEVGRLTDLIDKLADNIRVHA